ncbi:MAG TPA: DUF4357 domain-containing protein [Rhodanobacteraceae bacterium]|nr:DUF4357 domain-containing protein [Rhodanobacteraceae bacterium]
MSKMLTAGEQPIARVFSDDYLFTIPGYQRPYAWTKDQAEELQEDLRAAMAESGDVSQLPPYFLGSIVLVKEEGSPDAEVVDGQQRLTTLTLLLAALRTALEDDRARKGLSKLILEEGDVISGTQNRYRLALRERDNAFFREYVQDEGGIAKLVRLDGKLSDSQHNLRENAKLLLAGMIALPDAERLRLAQFIATRCYLVMVCTPDLESAYRIFDVLNSRGLNLAATDILKAKIIGQIAEDRRDAYTRKWEDVESELGREEFGNLFSHIRMIYRKAKPKGTLLKEFEEHVHYAAPAAFVDDILLPLAAAYSEIVDASYTSQAGAEVVNECLKWLNRVEFKDWLPPALAFLAAHRNQSEQVRGFFAALERLVYAMLIARWGVNERIERCSKLTTAIQSRADLTAQDSPLLLADYEKKAVYDALDGPLYATHSARALATILLRLDAWLSSGGAHYDYPIISIEHVLPQNPQPGSEWLTWFPDVTERSGWVHRLGNLMLLSRRKNSAASNYTFDYKKNVYFKKNGISPFALTTEVLGHKEWKPEDVSAVHRERLETFEKALGLQGRATLSVAPVTANASAKLTNLPQIFHCKASGADAHARCTSDGLVVLSGSSGRAETMVSLKGHTYGDLRSTLLSQGVIVETEDGRIRFEKDWPFKAPSTAAVAVMGRPANGWKEWRDENGVTLREACGVPEDSE